MLQSPAAATPLYWVNLYVCWPGLQLSPPMLTLHHRGLAGGLNSGRSDDKFVSQIRKWHPGNTHPAPYDLSLLS